MDAERRASPVEGPCPGCHGTGTVVRSRGYVAADGEVSTRHVGETCRYCQGEGQVTWPHGPGVPDEEKHTDP